jgi:hypothetical protein
MPAFPRWLGAASLLGYLVFSSPADAARAAESNEPPGGELRQPTLARRFGLEHLGALLRGVPSERIRGIQRLARLGTPRALDRLNEFALERRADLGAREWLSLARALAPHAAARKTRLLLALLMNQRTAEEAGPEEAALLELARGVAALALADEGSVSALEVLGRALRSGGPSAALAARALEGHPPARLEPLLQAPGEPSVELARLLGRLGDQRAFNALRAWVRGESAEVRAASAIALTELGDMETVPLARQWLAGESRVLQQAALRISMLAQDPSAAATLAEQLSKGPAGLDGLRQALAYPSIELLPLALAQYEPADVHAGWWWSLLGRIGGAEALRQLGAAQAQPDSMFAATHALSRLPGQAAQATLNDALQRRVALPLTLRAAAARGRFWDEHFELLSERISGLARSELPAERAAAAWASSLRSDEAALAELESGDEVRILAAANNALLFGDRVFRRAAELLSAAPPGRIRSALAFCLLRASGQSEVSSAVLRALVIEAGVARPLALGALAARDDSELSSFVQGYVAHPDALLRSNVARGLGESIRPSATGLLASGFEFETDESVRQAIVCALSFRHGRAATRTLELAARLDPSPRVRSAAGLALGGVRLGAPSAGSELLWAEVRSASAAGSTGGEPRAALVNIAPGLDFPAFTDAAGVLVVPGVGLGQLGIRLQ